MRSDAFVKRTSLEQVLEGGVDCFAQLRAHMPDKQDARLIVTSASLHKTTYIHASRAGSTHILYGRCINGLIAGVFVVFC